MGSSSSQPVAPATQLTELSQHAQSLPILREATSRDGGDTVTQKAAKAKNLKFRRSTGNIVDGRAAAGLRQATRRRSAAMETGNTLRTNRHSKTAGDEFALEGDAHNVNWPSSSTKDPIMVQTSQGALRRSGKKRKRHTGRPTSLIIAPPSPDEQVDRLSQDIEIPETQITSSSKHKQQDHAEDAELEVRTGDGSNGARREQIQPTPQAIQDDEDREVSNKSRKRKRQSKTIPVEEDEVDKVQPETVVGKSKRKRSRKSAQQNLAHTETGADADLSRIASGGGKAAPSIQTPPSSPPTHNSIPRVRSSIQPTKSSGHVQDWLEEHIGPGMTGGPIKSSEKSATRQHERVEKSKYTDTKSAPEKEADAVQRRTSKSDRNTSAVVRDITAEEDRIPSYTHEKAPARRHHDLSLDKGKFTAEERKIAEDVFSDVCYELGIEAVDLTFEISSWGSPNAQVFAKAIQEALPRRSGAALRKFSQRRWHNNDRGPWSSIDDERLRTAWNDQPNNWSYCSEQTNRTAADCSSRWRNYLKYDGKVELGPWTQYEENKLSKVVEECIKKIKTANSHDRALCRDREQLEKLLHWDTVSQMMGSRSAKRCNEKWVKLRRRNDSNRIPNNTMYDDQLFDDKMLDGKMPKKIRRMKITIAKLKRGDKLRIMWEIADADQSGAKAYRDESTFWSIVAQKAKSREDESLYTTVMRRWVYREALDEYPQVVLRDGTIAANAKALAQHMTQQYQDDGKGLPLADLKELKKKKRGKLGESASSNHRSRELIEDSDIDDQNDEHTEKSSVAQERQSDEDDDDAEYINGKASEAAETITSLESYEHDAQIASKVARKLFTQRQTSSGADLSARKSDSEKARDRVR
ncbi:hypothetical protein K431DRAFT_282188 [Polychaeton citri CBS 116435]|uniref:Myb-like domain-containing protein n=1 Tax=Polychaeton citri CBS 116435 TaxID=1314669 RepID=A0A9P4QDD0_9PEZI|nr:hypothetical protein K431DRAFT_282188 [Polychaeton citri CBS 116435]